MRDKLTFRLRFSWFSAGRDKGCEEFVRQFTKDFVKNDITGVKNAFSMEILISEYGG